jgi:G3E family GTPase
MNPYARIIKAERCAVPLDAILGQDAFSLERVLAVEPEFLEPAGDHDHDHHGSHGHGRGPKHYHDEEVQSVALSADRPLDGDRFMTWFREVLQTQGPTILRTKGILDFKGERRRYVVHGIHMLMDGDFLGPWKAGETPRSRLVFIGRDLDRAALETGFAATVAP